MIETYILPVLLFAAIGAIAAILLTFAGKLFYVESDERMNAILSALPQINCGACGYSGCEDYAKNIVSGEAMTNLCKPGGDKCSREISEAMGVPYIVVEPVTAFIRCNGNCFVTEDKYIYAGTASCNAVNSLYNGKGTCRTGCLGLGDCASVCQYGAIKVTNNLAVVNPDKCTGCGMCVKICPNELIVVRRATQCVDVACSSIDTGKVTKDICKNGCIACKICEKKCPNDAIHVISNHAVIDYEKCNLCNTCAEACPKKCIHIMPTCSAVKNLIDKTAI